MEINKDRFLWLDLETSGLDPHRHEILEVAAIVTDNYLSPIASFYGRRMPEDLERINFSVAALEMHQENGLIDEIKVGTADHEAESLGSEYVHVCRPLHRIEEGLADFIVGHAYGAPLAGSSIHFDRGFMEVRMPGALRQLHYRNFDVSTFKEAIQRWCPGVELEKSDKAHRAFGDIKQSIELAKFSCNLFGVPPQ